MRYEIMQQRLQSVLHQDKYGNAEQVCEILRGELSPIIQSYIELNSKVSVRAHKEGERLVFSVEFDAARIRNYGYLPKLNN